MNQVKIGELIAILRKEKGLTQAQLAEKIGVSDRAVSKWERGICMPEPSKLGIVADILEISVSELLNGERSSNENNQDKKVATQQTKREVTNATSTKTYTVVRGDSLWKISKKYYNNGNQYNKIYNANRDKIKNPSLIYPGQVLTIP